jgi:membrane protease YdiL (CAAX protease family)
VKARRDPLRLALELLVYVFLYAATAFLFGPLFLWLGDYLIAITTTGLLSACFANWLTMRIFEARPLPDIGLYWNPASVRNLGFGLIGGCGSAALVLSIPLLTGAARISGIPGGDTHFRTIAFVALMLLFGAAGEEILFRGYGFQVLLTTLGPMATILPVGVLFALLHAGNPNATPLGLANTAGFGILFGYAFLRSRDLWLPIGLHFGWNLTLPLFGVNVSGLKIDMTGYAMQWTTGTLWSGGAYGPEASVLTSAVLFALFVFLCKVPIRRQPSPLLDPPRETPPCEPGPQQSPLLP